MSKVKFRFGNGALVAFSFICKDCAHVKNSHDILNPKMCPVMRHAYEIPEYTIFVNNSAWWANSEAQNIGIYVEDMLERYTLCSCCKRIAQQCAHNKQK